MPSSAPMPSSRQSSGEVKIETLRALIIEAIKEEE